MGFYRLLLWLYPASFRNEYGEEMVRLFAERRREATPGARLGLWLEALGDALATAPAAHIDILRQDLKYSLRTLAHSPGFTATAVVVMALGIGATTAVFTIVDRVLLRPLPFAESERLVRIWENVPGYPQLEPSPLNFRDWTGMTASFNGMAAHAMVSFNMIHHEPERVVGAAVTWNLLPLLGIQPSLGRGFAEAEDRPGPPSVVIISDRLWRRSFGGDPAIVGRSVRLDQDTATIVGVMPPDFYFPDRTTDLWVTARFGPQLFQDGDNNFLGVVARLKPGVSLEMARTEMTGVTAALERVRPVENAQTRATVRLLADLVPRQTRMLLRALAAASLCLLLIACSNLASLFLSRFIARRREIVVRAALGAGRERLVRQLFTESLLLSLAGGALGVIVAATATPLLVRLVPATLPIADASIVDGRVLLFALAATILTGIAFGVLPAWRSCAGVDASAITDATRGVTSGGERLRSALITAQMAASIALLIGGGLLVRALVRVQMVDPGFATEQVLTLRTALAGDRYASALDRARFYDRVIAEVQALQGVTAAAYTSFAPMVMRGGIWPVEIPGVTLEADADTVHTASLRFVTPGFFETLGIPRRGGRDVSASDTFEAPFVAVVSESFARRYWPRGDAIGQRFRFAFRERLIVGIVADIRVRGLEAISEPQVYLPYRQVPDGGLPFYTPKDLLIRTTGSPMALAPAVQRIVRDADPELPVSDIKVMADVVALQTTSRRTQVAVVALFGAMSVVLSAVGLHGLLAFSVAQKRREIGIRIALGAKPARVIRMVALKGATLAGWGVAAGMVLGYIAGRLLADVLFGVRPADPLTFGAAALVALLMTVSGTILPALRAVRVDPLTAIRVE
jgi:predicted permease